MTVMADSWAVCFLHVSFAKPFTLVDTECNKQHTRTTPHYIGMGSSVVGLLHYT